MQQTPLSLMHFQKKFGTEKACQKHLFRLRWPEGFRCPRCQHGEAYFHRSRHLYHCKACGYQASLTAGTVFHKTRTPLHKWFWMIWLMGRQKSGISMLSLQRMLEIKTYKTVWTMGHKIRQALDGIGVGRQGFTWSGVKSIVRKTEWPDWYPPPEMIARQPYLPRMIAGGPGNPLGARALYLGNSQYRIHGTNDPSTIGHNVSSGCIRLTNQDVTDLFGRACRCAWSRSRPAPAPWPSA